VSGEPVLDIEEEQACYKKRDQYQHR
jgi:hypothetical protein